MTLSQVAGAYAGFFIVTVVFLGLLVGSFLNVVIHRLPVMMERGWRKECCEFLELEAPATEERYDLIKPDSHCPQCKTPIKPWQNIPIISYALLGGRCGQCRTKISPRYPIIELVTGILSGFAAWHFGYGLALAGALLLTWCLVALTMIDIDHQLLPDSITLPLLWAGLLLNTTGVYTDLQASVIGAAAGYLSLWSIYWLFKLATGKEGMGYGDFKLLAVLGAWMGWQALPMVILLSSVVGAAIGITMILALGRDRNIPIPFGPYLAIAGWIAFIWGDTLTQRYLQFAVQ